MTSPTPAIPQFYNGDGVTVDFPIPWPFSDASYVKAAIGATPTAITVVGDAEAGYSARFATAPAAGTNNVVIWRAEPSVNVTDFKDLRRFPAEVVEIALDRLARAGADTALLAALGVKAAPADYGKAPELDPLTGNEGGFLQLQEGAGGAGTFKVGFIAGGDIAALAAVSDALTALSDYVAEIAALGDADAIADMDLLATAANISNMDALADAGILAAISAIKADLDLDPNSNILNAEANALVAFNKAAEALASATSASNYSISANLAEDSVAALLAALNFLSGVSYDNVDDAVTAGGVPGKLFVQSDDTVQRIQTVGPNTAIQVSPLTAAQIALLANANLLSLAAVAGAADMMAYFTGVGALAATPLTAQARNLLDDADAPTMRTTLGVVNVPTGSVIQHAAATPPSGFLKCNGAAVSRTTYAALFAVIGTTYGVGDGSTTFNLPELRGEFVRGLDDGRGVDTGRAIGSAQAGQMPAHTHSYQRPENGGSGAPGGSGGSLTGDTTGSAGGTNNASENRPRNVALLFCIKT